MSTATVAPLEQLRRKFDPYLARLHPGLLLRHVECIDNTTGDRFRFHFSPAQLIRWATSPNPVAQKSIPADKAELLLGGDYEETGWEWQGDLIDWWIGSDITLILKARQLGITWCAAGVALWYLLFVPGARVLVQSKNEDDAADLVDHIWEMYLSLRENHPHLVSHVRVQKPSNPDKHRPHLDIEMIHPDGRVSQLNAMASTAGAGHGRTAAFVILDEFSRHPYGREAYKAVVPAQGGSKRARGKTAIISTANGISVDEESGNFYHHLYDNAARYGIRTRFLKWDQNPDRDQEWYDAVAMKLPPKDRGEQYPQTPEEAFILTGDTYFDVEAMKRYAEKVREPLFRGVFEETAPGVAKLRKSEFGAISVWEPPQPGHEYAIGADTATGRGKDFSCAYVVDLSTMELVAEFHDKIDADQYAAQLHYLGHWYGAKVGDVISPARLAVETQGGYGEAVIIPLRDGRAGRPPYSRLYRHVQGSSTQFKRHQTYGFPMNNKTRPLVISQLEQAIREDSLPHMAAGLLSECRTFVHATTNPSPRAAEGCNDDRVMAAAITLELYRLHGKHPDRFKAEPKPAEVEREILRRRDGSLDPKVLERRYPKGGH